MAKRNKSDSTNMHVTAIQTKSASKKTRNNTPYISRTPDVKTNDFGFKGSHRIRDNGQFGSYPLYDDCGDYEDN